MFTRQVGFVLGAAALCAVFYVGIRMLPDLQRYMRIRNM
jgi:hypothetical protein